MRNFYVHDNSFLYMSPENYTRCRLGRVKSLLGTRPESPPESIALHIKASR